jgi:hypothetical protein
MELIVPIKGWVREILEKRENNPKASNTKMPFIIATSTSKVVNTKAKYANVKDVKEKLGPIFKKNEPSDIYYGCILSNNINPNLNYSNNKTSIGYDLTGKLIVAEEYGRKVPTPIITSFDIDTGGRNNALKKGTLNIKCFSLKQFEMFEQFYCKFGMYILVEFGDNTFVEDNGVSINKKKYDTFIEEYSELIDYQTDINLYFKYLRAIELGKGAYDRFAGLVSTYQYSIDSDGTYNVSLQLIQTNQITLSVPNVYSNNNVDIGTPNNSGLLTFDQWFLQIKTDLNLDDVYVLNQSEWQSDFFNWGKINTNKLDESSSSEPYISLRLALDILNHNIKNGIVNPEMWKFNLPKYEINGKLEEIIPIKIHKNLISKNDSVLFPTSELIQFDILDNKIGILDKTVDGRINGKDILEKRTVKFAINRMESVDILPKDDYRLGNALNIFIKYRDVADLWLKTYNKIDYLEGILNLLNESGYGFYSLAYGPLRENQYSTIVDLNLFNEFKKPDNLYRFKSNTINSIVRDMQFTFTPSKRQASFTIYNQDIQHSNIINPSNELTDKSKEILLPSEFMEKNQLYMNMNADGYFSINQIQVNREIKNNGRKKSTSNNPASNTKTKEEIKSDLIKKLNNYSKLFKMPDGTYRVMVFANESLVLQKLAPTINKDNTSATPIDVTLVIDGLAGFNCGEYFSLDGVPETYNLLGVFRIKNVKQNITDENGWITTLECNWMINN